MKIFFLSSKILFLKTANTGIIECKYSFFIQNIKTALLQNEEDIHNEKKGSLLFFNPYQK